MNRCAVFLFGVCFLLSSGLLSCSKPARNSPVTVGVVTDAQTGEPIEGVQVRTKSYDRLDTLGSVAIGSFDSATTDVRGQFSITKGKTYAWSIFAWKDGYYPTAKKEADFSGSLSLTKAREAKDCSVESFVVWLGGGSGIANWGEWYRVSASHLNGRVLEYELSCFQSGKSFQTFLKTYKY